MACRKVSRVSSNEGALQGKQMSRNVLGRVGVISTDMEDETDERTETAFFR